MPFGTVSTRLEHVACHCVAERRNKSRNGEMRNVASIGGMSNSATRDLIDRRSMILSRANTTHEL
jgi:hypothetical protein